MPPPGSRGADRTPSARMACIGPIPVGGQIIQLFTRKRPDFGRVQGSGLTCRLLVTIARSPSINAKTRPLFPAPYDRNAAVNQDLAVALVSDMLLTALFVAMPILGVALGVGLLISILQVVTQIQEMTLTFVPKILAVVAVLLVFGQWMLTSLTNYATALISNIPSYF